MHAKSLVLALLCLATLTSCGFQNPSVVPPGTPADPPNPPVTPNTPPQPANSGPLWPADKVEVANPPTAYSWSIPWCEAICDTSRRNEVGTVSISYLRLHAILGGTHLILIDQQFNSVMCGGLYIRSPWFGYGTSQANTFEPIPYTIANGYATVEPSDQQDKVYHWYSCGRCYTGTPEKIWVEARVKITGSACFQLGWDYWTAEDGGDALEGGSTRWYYNTDAPNWTILTLGQ